MNVTYRASLDSPQHNTYTLFREMESFDSSGSFDSTTSGKAYRRVSRANEERVYLVERRRPKQKRFSSWSGCGWSAGPND
ncbi:hypothetical protein PM082_018768 [Marasmius tenuissimus]|nr:hypothetical protein PM082_018768 [Marasmius tenuissimus]